MACYAPGAVPEYGTPRAVIARTSTGTGIAFSPEDRTRHVYIVGKSGSGKSTLLFNLAMQDIHAGEGICVIDPHGRMALLSHIPYH